MPSMMIVAFGILLILASPSMRKENSVLPVVLTSIG